VLREVWETLHWQGDAVLYGKQLAILSSLLPVLELHPEFFNDALAAVFVAIKCVPVPHAQCLIARAMHLCTFCHVT
jgi:hypothetical protein